MLDAGCGNGDLLMMLHRKGLAAQGLYGCDIETGHVHVARLRTGLLNIVVADYARGTGPFERRFDFVVAISWLHNDWRHRHALGAPQASKPDPQFAEHVIQSVSHSLKTCGQFIFDWRCKKALGERDRFRALLEDSGFRALTDLPCRHAGFPTYAYEFLGNGGAPT